MKKVAITDHDALFAKLSLEIERLSEVIANAQRALNEAG